MKVYVDQLHRAVVEQRDCYTVPEGLIKEYTAIEDDSDKEMWLYDNCDFHSSNSEISEILETVDISIIES